jgi:nucleoside-diphosphate-sugar epimerase
MVPKINPYKRPHKVYLEGNWPTEPKKVPGYVRNNYPIFLEASDEHGGPIRVAIVCPQTIYGLGRGPGNKRSQQLYDLARIILSNGKGVRVGKGENRQTHVHIHDLSDIFVALVEEAAAGGGKATWGREGYYFASRNDHVSLNSLLLYYSQLL